MSDCLINRKIRYPEDLWSQLFRIIEVLLYSPIFVDLFTNIIFTSFVLGTKNQIWKCRECIRRIKANTENVLFGYTRQTFSAILGEFMYVQNPLNVNVAVFEWSFFQNEQRVLVLNLCTTHILHWYIISHVGTHKQKYHLWYYTGTHEYNLLCREQNPEHFLQSYFFLERTKLTKIQAKNWFWTHLGLPTSLSNHPTFYCQLGNVTILVHYLWSCTW